MSFSIEPSTEISHRTDFSILANARGYTCAVEVGVEMAVFARDFLSRWRGHLWVGVDPYLTHPHLPLVDRDVDMMMAVQALAEFHGRTRIFRIESVAAAANWPHWMDRPSFVYLDGSHAEADVAADMEAWWPLLPDDHGMLAGHDYDPGHGGVIAAVNRFARERGLVVRVTGEDSTPSWYVYRAEPPTLHRRFFTHRDEPNPHAG